jgi:dihydrolipoamide dehydrogenase
MAGVSALAVKEAMLTVSAAKPDSGGSYDFDVAVIGGGPGGYVAAIRAAQLGAKTALIEKESLGGTCLNVGCIPTKAVISSVALFRNMQNASAFGLSADNLAFDMAGISGGARKVVKQLVGGVGVLLKKNGIAHIRGLGSFVTANSIRVQGEAEQTITAKNVIVATGSVPSRPPIEGLDAFPEVWTSDNAVFADRVPGKLLVVGAGAIGLEFAYIFNALGSSVTVVEMMPQILPAADAEAAAELAKHLRKQGITIKTGTTLKKALVSGKQGRALINSGDGEETLDADVILLAAGRKPSTEGLNLDAIGVRMNRAAVAVDANYQTSVPGVYAIGDCIGEPLLAHAASAEGEAAAETIMGHPRTVNYHAMPAAVYTHPELASVGDTEAQAREKHADVVVGKFAFAINGRALGGRETEGFVKLVVSEKHGEILGAHIVGPHASDLLAECATAIASEITVDELIHSVHAHPTLSEVVMEAAHDARGRCIHKV